MIIRGMQRCKEVWWTRYLHTNVLVWFVLYVVITHDNPSDRWNGWPMIHCLTWSVKSSMASSSNFARYRRSSCSVLLIGVDPVFSDTVCERNDLPGGGAMTGSEIAQRTQVKPAARYKTRTCVQYSPRDLYKRACITQALLRYIRQRVNGATRGKLSCKLRDEKSTTAILDGIKAVWPQGTMIASKLSKERGYTMLFLLLEPCEGQSARN